MTQRETFKQFARPAHSSDHARQIGTKIASAIRSIGAVLIGLIAITILSIGTDVLMQVTGIHPPWGDPMSDSQFALATTYRSTYAIAGSYITARFAPRRPMQHAIALGFVGFAVALVGTVATWNAGPAFARKWYPITLIVISIPCAWLGGRLNSWSTYMRRTAQCRNSMIGHY